MTEKDLDSMATVQIKPEYAPSEVYSTTSEPPPAYKRRSTSVQIAKIVAFTVIASSFVIGTFILASAYLTARASCDQMQALDNVLEKELMLETLQQVNKEIPRAEALVDKENNELDLQSLDKEEPIKKDEEAKQDAEQIPIKNTENDSETDSSFSDSDEADDLQKIHMKVPLELDLSDLAAALLETNQRSRMNCVVERKQAEELVDSPVRNMQLAFGVIKTDPKKQKIIGERISIFCESGSENNRERNNEDAEPIRPLFFPFQKVPIPFGVQPNQVPLTHMPQRMPPQPMIHHQMPLPYIRPPLPQPQQVMQAPHPEPHIRIQVQRIPVREIHLPRDMAQLPIPIPHRSQMEPAQLVPLTIALEHAGITDDDLRNIQHMAEQKFTEELQHLAEEGSSSESSSEEDESESQQTNEQQEDHQQQQQQIQQQQHQEQQQIQQIQQLLPQIQQAINAHLPDQQILQIGRAAAFGRSILLPTPIRTSEMAHESDVEPMRPHYVQPR